MREEGAPAVILSEEVYDAMVALARAEAPREACGLVGGREGRGTRFYPCRNRAYSPVAFVIDPEELLRTFQKMDQEGIRFLGVFHSHPTTGAWPSATDVLHAQDPTPLHLILSLAEGFPSLRVFQIQGGKVVEGGLTVTEKPPPPAWGGKGG